MSTPTDRGPCGVCKGGFSEHFDDNNQPITQHAYVPEGGNLMTQKEASEAQAPQPQRVPINSAMAYMGNAGLSVARLCEVLLAKQLLTDEECLYIAGMIPFRPGSPQETAMKASQVRGKN